jgi:6-phosphogluconolactonase
MSIYAYVGTRTTRERNARGEGISVYRVVAQTGVLELLHIVRGLTNPSYLLLNSAQTHLYCIHGDGSEVSAFRINADTAKRADLQLINRVSCEGINPVHLSWGHDQEQLFIANHLSGTVVSVSINADASLGAVSQTITMLGELGPHKIEQTCAKPHFNCVDRSGQFLLVPDKGLDKVFNYRITNGKLHNSPAGVLQGREGSGPRHLALHPDGKHLYIINELNSTLTSAQLDPASGALTAFQIVSSLSDSYVGDSRAAAIQIDASGNYLYVSNRGEDSVGVFAINQQTFRLTHLQTISSGGKTPRFITLSPNQEFLYALNEDSDSIALFTRDSESGLLQDTGQRFGCASAVCMVFTHA